MNDVSIIIVNYNGRKYLRNCLASLRQSDAAGAEIVVVDNGSTDGSLEEVEQVFPGLTVIRMGRNSGFAEANNAGAKQASGRYLVFLNNDTVVTQGWLAPLLAAMNADRTVGVAGSKLRFMDRRDRIMSAGINILFNGTGYDIGFLDRDEGQYDTPGPRGAICGAALMVRREEFLSVGGFDERYFLYAEDIDLCWRYWLFGYTVQYVPSSVVFHAFGGTSGPDRHNPARVFFRVRNGCFNILKNYECAHVPWPLLFNLLFHLFEGAYFLLTGRWKSAWAIARAYADGLRSISWIRKTRRAIQTRRTVPDSVLFKGSLIVRLAPAMRESLRIRRLASVSTP